MGTIRMLQGMAYVAGLGALALAVGANFTSIDLSIAYLIVGGAVVLALLALSIALLFIQGMRLLALIGIVDALIAPILLLQVLTFGTMHGLVQATYLLLAVDVVGFTQALSRRYNRLASAPVATEPSPRRKP